MIEPVCYCFFPILNKIHSRAHIKSPFVIVFLRKKNHFLEFCIRLLQLFKKTRIKKNLKTVSNEKLLRAASQKIIFFREERKYDLKD